MPEPSTKPYLLRAIYEWCVDNGFTPYIVAAVDNQTQVPREYVRNSEIVLNISFTATDGLKMDNEFIYFKARFGGVAREIFVPVGNVVAIYARENGQGMAFDIPKISPNDGNAELQTTAAPQNEEKSGSGLPTDSDPSPKKGRPALTRVK